jgi:hypothetical protein
MRRYGNLWPRVGSFEALLHAAEQACKGKRFRPDVAAFQFRLEAELWQLHEELSAKTYRPGAYRTFVICEPKPRQISAAPYRHRMVHHALVNVLEPIYERTFIRDSYACRKGKGTHAAVRRCQHFARRFRLPLLRGPFLPPSLRLRRPTPTVVQSNNPAESLGCLPRRCSARFHQKFDTREDERLCLGELPLLGEAAAEQAAGMGNPPVASGQPLFADCQALAE